MWLAPILLAFLVALFLYLDSRKPKNFPPGPSWWPVVGCLFELNRLRKKMGTLCIATSAMARQHCQGKMVGLRVGTDVQVVITSSDIIREMATKAELDGRPRGPFYRFRTWGLRRGILLTDDDFWREQRRFIVRHLRDFGLGKSGHMETIIMREVQALSDFFSTAISNTIDGKAVVELHDAFGLPMLNTIWVMLAGIRYDPDDVELRKLQKILADMFASMDMTGCLFNQFPWMRFVMPEASGYTHYMQAHQKLWSFLHEELLRHQFTYVDGSTRDFMDVYIAELKSRKEENSYYTELQLMAICVDMFMAGSDTTNKSLSFAFLHFLRQPGVVRKVQEEIDGVVGRGRKVTLEDRPNLPYTEATVNEAIRVFAGQSFAVPHRAMADSTLGGYFIPKDTILAMNFNGILMNEDLYKEPWTFSPERFLNDKGEVQIPDNFIPFGVGRRRCIGDTLAKTNIFLFIANLLHTFDFENAPGSPPPDPFPIEGITPFTQPYEAQISLRA